MWNERILEAKKAQGLSPKMMSERTQGHLPERTIIRILSGETPNPRIDTIIELGTAVGLTPQELFADTNVLVASETLVEVKETLAETEENLAEVIETAEVVEAEKKLAEAELDALRARVAAQDTEIAVLKEKLRHKEELLAVYNYFTKIKSGE
jgi:transcriptional regulator with XRE-family HTH domain